jgi:hypothetical protein
MGNFAMNRSRARLFLSLASIGITLAGCQMVKLDEGASDIRVLADRDSDASETEKSIAATCEELGTTRVEVLSKVGFIKRGPEKVARELDNLARNEAVEMGGNAVVASGKVEAGKRRYRILRCPPS